MKRVILMNSNPPMLMTLRLKTQQMNTCLVSGGCQQQVQREAYCCKLNQNLVDLVALLMENKLDYLYRASTKRVLGSVDELYSVAQIIVR